ncbi:MAG TPA: alpha/beta fold hydrolase [Desulfocapsa sulfexigens]|nr:alpha/beta fold hydrolase [Desulfocapsa sulfexigens]
MTAHFCQDILIPCSHGNLEGRLTYKEENKEQAGVIIYPPHPLLAGNMDNNVVTALAETLADHFPVLSFNYRGVGKSFKAEPDLPLFEYWNRLDQNNDFSAIIADTKELIHWSKRFFKNFHLLGYSFGSFIGLSALSEPALSFCGITPPLTEHDFSRLTWLSCKLLLLFAENDNLIGKKKAGLPPHASIHEISNSDHFFLGSEQQVAHIVKSFLLAA